MTAPNYTKLDAGIAVLREAHRYVDMHEVAPNAAWSRKPESLALVEALRAAGWQLGWPYCAAFVEACVGEACYALGDANLARLVRKRFTPSVMETYRNVRALVHRNIPAPGAVFFMQKGTTGLGHMGFVLLAGPQTFVTIEGNTSPGIAAADRDREGDGIYFKLRRMDFAPHATALHLLGFVDPVDDCAARLLIDTYHDTED